MKCHYCDRDAAYAAEKDGIKVGLCERHFRERVEELADSEELAACGSKSISTAPSEPRANEDAVDIEQTLIAPSEPRANEDAVDIEQTLTAPSESCMNEDAVDVE
nr:DUF6757 family protein [Halogeometricum sp. CBA1124]